LIHSITITQHSTSPPALSHLFLILLESVSLLLHLSYIPPLIPLGMGESLTIVSTVFWTLHITYTDMATEYVDSISMMCIQLGVVTFLSCLAALLLEVYLVSPLFLPSSLLSSPRSLYYFLFTYLLSLLLTFLLSSLSFPPISSPALSASAVVLGSHIPIFALADLLGDLRRCVCTFPRPYLTCLDLTCLAMAADVSNDQEPVC
jgi:hypothetical protein